MYLQEAPRVTVNNHRMTNVSLPGGAVIQGIRRNNDLGHENLPPAAYEPENPMRPLRCTSTQNPLSTQFPSRKTTTLKIVFQRPS